LRFCCTCKIYKPNNQVTHCRECNVCVRRMDHHCKWFGTCVGLRNYRYFLLFTLTTALYAFIALIGSLVFWAAISQDEAGMQPLTSGHLFYSMSTSPLIFPLCFYLLCSTTILGFLFIYHLLYVIPTLTTTQEIIKKANEVSWQHSPSDRFSFWQSLDYILFDKLKPSLIEFRAPIVA